MTMEWALPSTSRMRLTIVLVAALLCGSAAVLTAPAWATFKGRNGRIAWAVYNAGGGGGGGYAGLTTFSGAGHSAKSLGYCAEDDSFNVCENWYDVDYSPDGTQLLWNQPDSTGKRVIMLAGANAGHPTQVEHEAFDDTQASFSPGGNRIVYARQEVGAGGQFGTIVTSDLAGGGIHVVTSLQGSAPRFTPDARRILFIRPDKYGYPAGLWSIGRGGSGLHRLIAHTQAFDISPDGAHVAYVNKPGDLYVANADGSHGRRVAPRPGGDPIEALRYSPTGKLIVFAGEGMGNALFTVRAGGGKPKLIVNNGDGRTDTSGLSWQPLPR